MIDISNIQLGDIANVVTVVGVPIAAISLFLTYKQLSQQAQLNSKEICLSGLIKFNEMQQELSEMRRDIENKFKRDNKSVSYGDLSIYYRKYWLYCELEWTYFARGLVPLESFSAWMMSRVQQLAGNRNLSYHEDGSNKLGNSKDIFKRDILDGLYLRSGSCRDYYKGLLELTESLEARSISLTSDAAFSEIKRYIRSVCSRRKIKPIP